MHARLGPPAARLLVRVAGGAVWWMEQAASWDRDQAGAQARHEEEVLSATQMHLSAVQKARLPNGGSSMAGGVPVKPKQRQSASVQAS